MTRWRLTIEYDGSPFMGWQRQDHGASVQQTLEEALERMTGNQAAFTAAGRTDAGVHALAMAAHVDVTMPLTPQRLRDVRALRPPIGGSSALTSFCLMWTCDFLGETLASRASRGGHSLPGPPRDARDAARTAARRFPSRLSAQRSTGE